MTNKKSLRFLKGTLIAVCVLVSMVCAPLIARPVQAATEYYSYDFIYTSQATLDAKVSFWGDPVGSDQDILNDYANGMKNYAADLFAAKMAQTGHWYKVNSITSTNMTLKLVQWTHGWPGYGNLYRVYVTAATDVNFETDINEPSKGPLPVSATVASPHIQLLTTLEKPHIQPVQAEEILWDIWNMIVTAFSENTKLFMEGCIIIGALLTIAAIVWYLSAHGGIANVIAPGLGGEILTGMIIVGVILALIVGTPALADRFLPKKKK